MTTYTTNVHATPSNSGGRRSFWQRVQAALAVRRQRNRLATLDSHLLKDIGLTEESAEREVKRKIWDVPQHWLQ